MNGTYSQEKALKKVVGLATLFMLFAAQAGYAQIDPCGAEFNFSVTKSQLLDNEVNWRSIGNRMQRCDSVLVMSKAAYGAVVIERAYYKELTEKFDSLVAELEDGRTLRDSLNATQRSFIQFQQGVITKYDGLLLESNQLVKDANANTERALRRLTLLRWASIGGIVIGAGGLLVALAVQ